MFCDVDEADKEQVASIIYKAYPRWEERMLELYDLLSHEYYRPSYSDKLNLQLFDDDHHFSATINGKLIGIIRTKNGTVSHEQMSEIIQYASSNYNLLNEYLLLSYAQQNL